MQSQSRSYLYVPGDRPDRLNRAFERGADAIIADLEDAVAAQAKDTARDGLLGWLNGLGTPPAPIWVRINTGARQKADLGTLAGCPAITGFCVPKAESASDLAEVDEFLNTVGSTAKLAPLIESARGLLAATDIARSPRVVVLHIGEVDLAADLVLDPGPDETELLYARSLVVIASRAAGIEAPIAPVSTNFSDQPRFEESSRLLRRMGFFGRACIHPRQVAVANQVFSFADSEREWAQSLLALVADGGQGAISDDAGNMIDEAVLRRARRILNK